MGIVKNRTIGLQLASFELSDAVGGIDSGELWVRAVRFRDIVTAEFERRCRQNARYSLRGFALALGVHHATLSRLINSNRRIQDATISAVGRRLGLTSAQIVALVGREDIAAVSVAIARPAFRADSRWLASITGISLDRVNIALQSLLCAGRLRMLTATQWLLVYDEGAMRNG